jgi:ribosomal protein S18 acetylase RimI-like enzyme
VTISGTLHIRPMTEPETDVVAAVWFRSGKLAYAYLPAWRTMTPDIALGAFRNHIAAHCDVYVAEQGGEVLAFLAMRGSYVDRLYVDPAHQTQGVGTALIAWARRLSPDGLELHTHQQNTAARSFYERLGFVAVRFGLSPAPESAPDVEYHWRS